MIDGIMTEKEYEKVKREIMLLTDVNVRMENDFTLLMLAAYHGHEELAQLLLDRGADLHVKDTFGQTALGYTISEEYMCLNLTRLLLRYGANVNDLFLHMDHVYPVLVPIIEPYVHQLSKENKVIWNKRRLHSLFE